MNSILSIEEAITMRAGKRLVFTNGVFDVLHAGHVSYLKEARQLGDLLIVGLNSDESVRKLGKGPERPIHCLEDRAVVMSSLRFVDGVISFSDTDPCSIISILKPEIHVKGGDYAPEDLPEARIIRGYGGEIVIVPLLPGRSTTEIAKRIRGE